MLTESKLEQMFLDYFNNFLTIERFADYYNLDLKQAEFIIDKGRQLHQIRVDILKYNKKV